MTVFKSNTLEIIARSELILSAIVKDPRKAVALNKILKHYPDLTNFSDSEVLFSAPKTKLLNALITVGLLREELKLS